jgi:hypothetical protein
MGAAQFFFDRGRGTIPDLPSLNHMHVRNCSNRLTYSYIDQERELLFTEILLLGAGITFAFICWVVTLVAFAVTLKSAINRGFD